MGSRVTGQSFLNATDPLASAWVSANAGAGKTRLLTDRVLRLLLGGNAPSRILCITYTTAASAEMKTRIHAVLSRWSALEEKELQRELAQLNGHAADRPTLRRAKTLFTSVLEAPEGLRIQTIHGFCQSLLKRFPLEAGVQPNFSVLDEGEAAALVREAALKIYALGEKEAGGVTDALEALEGRMSESSLRGLIGELIGERRHLHTMFNLPGGVNAVSRKLYAALSLPPGVDADVLIGEEFAYTPQELALLHEGARAMQRGKGKDAERGEWIAAWLECPHRSAEAFESYAKAFIKSGGGMYKDIHSRGCIDDETVIAALRAEQTRVHGMRQKLQSLRVARTSMEVLHVAHALVAIYDALKDMRAALDYDDLMLLARDLLTRPGIAPWVLYKLDGGIDHILLDEAQDTAPEQWQIIAALATEFFAGEGARAEAERTLFVVGDVKQSIYSFQGAAPEGFERWRAHFRALAQGAGKRFMEEELPHSYRSAAPVLQAVDAVFAGEENAMPHLLKREGFAGKVEWWPLVEAKEREEKTPWELPLVNKQPEQPMQVLAQRIAATVAGWMAERRLLEAKGRPVKLSDIMVLVRRRSPFGDMLTRSLKRKGIAVAGADRMVLTDNLAVQDMMALGRFLALPEDDLSLAELLRSPLFGFSDAQLFALAYRREGSLWAQLQAAGEEVFAQAVEKLERYAQKAERCTPYAFFAHVLEACAERRRITGRMGEEYNEALDEFLNQLLLYESKHTPSLQGALHWLELSKAEVKRDMEMGVDAVRIMTVHGAKGLQAPIVILPDTASTPKSRDRLLWQEAEDGSDLAFWSPSQQQDDALTRALREQRHAADMREYRRLLYVAMTRAEDELYICGYESQKKNDKSETWHQRVKDALAPLARRCDTPCGEGLSIEAAQEKETAAQAVAVSEAEESVLPGFLLTPPGEEPVHVHLRMGHAEDDGFSPLEEEAAIQRSEGFALLLKRLPAVAEEDRRIAADALLRNFAALDAESRTETAQSALALIGDTRWRGLLAGHALADVAVCGNVDGARITGRIDLLAVHEHAVWMLYNETHRRPPASVGHLAFFAQQGLAHHHALLRKIYPAKRLHMVVAWCLNRTLAEVPAEAFTLRHALLDEMA